MLLDSVKVNREDFDLILDVNEYIEFANIHEAPFMAGYYFNESDNSICQVAIDIKNPPTNLEGFTGWIKPKEK